MITLLIREIAFRLSQCMSTNVTDRQTDRQTDDFLMAIRRCARTCFAR